LKRVWAYLLVLACLSFASSAVAESGYSLPTFRLRTNGVTGQQFHCTVGYMPLECQREVVLLQTVLDHYQVEELGEWTWVLVSSRDWKPILLRVHLDPDSPAFSLPDQRKTFLEEVLFAPDAVRWPEILNKWKIPFNQFLDFAVTHELGHAFCNEYDESKAERYAKRLRKGKHPVCDRRKPRDVSSIAR
jgi:hypothetical protein